MIEQFLRRKRSGSGSPSAPYRFWRFNWIQSNSFAITVAEIRLIGLDDSVITQGYAENATASEFYNTNYRAAKAFDGIVPVSKDDLSHWQANNNTSTSWIKIQIPEAKPIKQYKIYCPRDAKYLPQNTFPYYSPAGWTLQGSNDNVAWSNIHSVSGQTMAKWLEKEEHIFLI